MIVSRRPRARALEPFVESVWVHRAELAHSFERVLPSGRMQLLVNIEEDELRDYELDGTPRHRTKGAGLTGAHARPVVIDTKEQRAICGVFFKAGGARPFFRAPAFEVTDSTVSLADLWGDAGAVVRERLLEARDPDAQLDVLEAILLEQAKDFAIDRAFARAHDLLTEGAAVTAVARSLGTSPRSLIERFRALTGLTPKAFARVARFQRLVRGIDGASSWTDLALAHGYADQAHMIREFKTFSGTTPTAYRARRTDERNHVALDVS